MGDTPILQSQLELLACSLEYRGNDATGIALQQEDGTVVVHKDDDAAIRYVKGDGFAHFCEEHLNDTTRIALVHTRKATKGTPFKNDNNHPLYSGKAAVVHNGMIGNDDFLFKDMSLERGAETDSDIIRAIIDRYGLTKKAIRQLNRMAGSVAAAIIHPEFPNTLMLLRSGNPLIIGASDDYLIGASDRRAVFQGLRPWVARYGFLMRTHVPNISFVECVNNTAIIHKDTKHIWHDQFNSQNYGSGQGIRYDVYNGDWQRRKKEQREEAKPPLSIVKAPEGPKNFVPPTGRTPEYLRCQMCNTVLYVPEESRHVPLEKMKCRKILNSGQMCKGPLGTVMGVEVSQHLPAN